MSKKIFRAHRSIKRRPPNSVKPKLKIFAYCEGQNTEPEFLKKFSTLRGNGLVIVNPIGASGVPMTIIEKAKQKKKELERASKKSKDPLDSVFEVWAVFDCDEHPNMAEAFNKASSNGIKIAFSNPCFELWPYLHYVDQSASIHRKDLQRSLARHISSYNEKGAKLIDPEPLNMLYDEARSRAIKLKEDHESVDSPMACPYTDVYELLDLIILNGKKRNSKT